ncbi:lytic transglycosylase domain-containing protein [Rubrivirga litoralis]|uniref:LysM peptidoglycan-binding domain-containing protein n=1 Tax=Rubrivirga litoralis TaxID=3075598 RepID=A0ABU3BMA9_9BACT|nr:LysM peptidoglycan-binding domain-containing protein [Rubrivirga sp. F394]MDT0630432.1 LysM peptidoglycan-binding domain-containing protein [Rubrivirga sp. F394]
MTRLTLLAAAALVAGPALGPDALAQTATTDTAPVRPATPLPTAADALLPGFVPADSVSDEELARRVAAFYTRQSALLQADADGDAARYAVLLDDLVSDVRLAAQRPGALLDDRLRAVYSSVLTEYERFYDRPALDRGDVYAVRTAGTDAVERGFDQGVPLLDHVTLPDLGAFATQVPMDVNPQVERYLQFLLKRPSHVSRLQSRADTYFPMVERVLAEEGVPDELKYLAMVESALNPVAQSHAGAAGMWQFIRATGRAYGLRSESEVDDRLDPEAATRAAARHLRDLYDRFGDWQLALAGYNCNPAVIARGVRRFEDQTGQQATFWDIDHVIPRETRAYVPMFIATSLVLSNPSAYGLGAYEPGPAYVFDRVPVAGGTRLASVARAIDVDEAVLRALNPSLKRGAAPAVRLPHMVRIPAGYYAEHAAALDRLAPPEANGAQFAAGTVQFGPRAVRPLAPQEHSDAVATLVARRETRRASEPRPQRVRRAVPVERYAAAAPPAVAAAEARADQTAAQVAQADAPGGVERAPAPAAEPAFVARREPTPGSEAEPAAERARPAPPAEAAVPVRVVSDRQPETHRVQRGEYLTSIAREHGTTVARLRALNGLRSDTVHPGQTLRVSGEAPAPAKAARPARPTTHRVRGGENLTGIAKRYGVTISQIREWNGLRSDVIRPGQRLRVSAAGSRG